MERYQKYKPSGVEWLGEVPEHWGVSKLKYLISVNDEQIDSTTPKTTQIKYVDISSVHYKNGIRKTEELLLSDAPSRARRKVRNGDIIVSTVRTYLKAIAVIENPPSNLIVSTGFAVIRPVDIQSKFLGYYFQSDGLVDAIVSRSKGVSYPAINPSEIADIEIAVPTAPEQTAIAHYLDRKTAELDVLIADKRRLLDLYATEKIALINQLCTRGRAPNAEMKESGVDWLGEVPADWDVTRLRYLGNCQNGIGISGDAFGSGYPFVSYSDVYNNAVIPDQVKGLVQSSDKDREKYSVKNGDVFFTRTSETVEEIAYAATCLNTIENATYAGFVIRWRPDDGRLHDGFKKYYFRAEVHRRFFVKEMNLVTRASLSQELLKRLPVLLPPWEEQVEIAKYLDSEIDRIDSLVIDTHHLIALLTEYRTTLISEAVTGQIKIPLES